MKHSFVYFLRIVVDGNNKYFMYTTQQDATLKSIILKCILGRWVLSI
jgi:hypothetical protein